MRAAMLPAAGAAAWWLLIAVSVASPDGDFWDCNSTFDVAINGVYAVGMVLIGLTLFVAARGVGRRWAGLGAVGLGAAVTVAVSNTLEHCASAPLGLPYVLGLLVTSATCVALGARLALTSGIRLEGVALLVIGIVPFPLGDRFALGFAAGLTLFSAGMGTRARHYTSP